MANAPATEPTDQVDEDVLCDIEDPVLFQAVLTRLKSMLTEDEWYNIAMKLASLSPRSLIVALAAGDLYFYNNNPKRLRWMIRGPNPYILKRPTMMHEVRELELIVSPHEQQIFSSVHHFTSLRKLLWYSDSTMLPDNAFSLLRQHLTGLQELQVYTERVTNPMLNDIAHMTNLESLRLVAVIDDVIPPLGNLRGLKTLTIWDKGRGERNEALVFPLTLEGLTRLETLELGAEINDDFFWTMPTMFPSLRALRVDRMMLSQDAIAAMESHYEDKEGFYLDAYEEEEEEDSQNSGEDDFSDEFDDENEGF